MFQFEFLQAEYFENSISDYLIALTIVLATGFLGHYLKEKIYHRINKIARKTTTKLDDIVVKVWNKIDQFLLFTVGLFFGARYLKLNPNLDQILYVALLFVIVFKVTRLIQALFDLFIIEYLEPLRDDGMDLDDQFLIFFRKLGDVTIWILAILFLVANLGVNITSLLTGLGVGGVALALGAQETISNVFAALALLGDKPFRTGDWTIIDGHEGTVKELGLRSVRLTTFDGTELIIPTTNAAKAVIENIDRRKTVRVVERIAISPETPYANLQKALEELRSFFSSQEEQISKFRVNISDFNDFAVNLTIHFWVKKPKDWDKFLATKSEINITVKEILDLNKIKIATRPPISKAQN